ncbi:MAG TPA: VOC family protein [Tepidisphaeraceae bacterium]|jgi:PhnB protein
MNVQPYLFFEGRCEEALEFYRKAAGAEVKMLMRFKDAPDPGMSSPGMENKVMHASVRIGETTLSASDGDCEAPGGFKGFALTILTRSEQEADRLFAALGEGGSVMMPLTKTFYSPRFGMVTDRFGVLWMVMVES